LISCTTIENKESIAKSSRMIQYLSNFTPQVKEARNQSQI